MPMTKNTFIQKLVIVAKGHRLGFIYSVQRIQCDGLVRERKLNIIVTGCNQVILLHADANYMSPFM